MPYGSEGYLSYHRDNERVANMIRSITQDGCRDLQKKTIDVIFVKKEIDGEDIGKICSDLTMKIAGSLKDYKLGEDSPDVEETIVQLISILIIDYFEGINPNKDMVWQINWLTKGIPLFSKKINTLPGTGKVAPMASLDKPDKKDDEIEEWWKI